MSRTTPTILSIFLSAPSAAKPCASSVYLPITISSSKSCSHLKVYHMIACAANRRVIQHGWVEISLVLRIISTPVRVEETDMYAVPQVL